MQVRTKALCVISVLSLAAAAGAQEQEPLSPEDQAALDAALEELAASEEVIEIEAKPIPSAPSPGVENVDREELHTMAGSRGDAIMAVANLPGIANADAYDGGGPLAIRGTSGEDSIVLVDGIPIPLAMHFGNVQSVLPTEMIESIELLPGGFDVENGRATGGVLSIRTRQRTPETWAGFTELSFINAAGFVEGPLSAKHGLTMAASFRRSIIDALLPAILPDDAPLTFRTPPRYYDGQLRIQWLPAPNHQVSLLAFGSDDRASLNLETVDPLDPVLTGDIAGRESFWRTALSWSYTRDKLENTATISFGQDFREQTLNNDQLFYRLEPSVFYARESLTYSPTDRVRLRAGTDLEVLTGNIAAHITLPPGEGANDPILSDDPLIDYDEDTEDIRAAGWLAADVRPVKEISLTPGVRVDRFDRISATVVQPRLAASLDFSPRMSLRAAVGLYSRPLALAEQLRDDLEPERAYHATSGIRAELADGVDFSVTGFLTELRDLVVRDPEFMGDDALAAYSNGGEGRVVGAEFLLRVQRRHFSGWLAYTASRSTRVDAAGMERRLFDYDQPHNLTAAGSYKLGKWRFGGRFRLASGTPTTPIADSIYNSDRNFYRPVYGEPNSDRNDLTHQLDLRVDRRFVAGDFNIDAFLDVSNVYNNPRHIGYEYSFDYKERNKLTDVPILPSFGIRGSY